MGIVFILIPVSLVLVGAAGWAFFWAVGSGQFDELDGPAWEILADDPASSPGVAPPAAVAPPADVTSS
jgi:cbb3-type cytochrome oxidase maturation protein